MVNLNDRQDRNGTPIRTTREERKAMNSSAPNYSQETHQRITAALARAEASTSRAHYMGRNERHGCTVYQVYSSKSRPTPYTLRVYPAGTSVLNAYAYLAPWQRILCECQAAQSGQACWHGATVARRLHREARAVRSLDAAVEDAPAADTKPARKLTLEDLFEDVA